jgi:hypothetical protein
LNTIAPFLEYARLKQGAQVLRHVGLGRVNVIQQLGHIFFARAQAAHDAQAHGGGHDSENFCGTVERGVIFLE